MNIAVIGAGLMGRAAVYDLARAEGVRKVGVFDIDPALAREIGERYGNGKAVCGKLDAGDPEQVASVLADCHAKLSGRLMPDDVHGSARAVVWSVLIG